jgi:hypothetical protein
MPRFSCRLHPRGRVLPGYHARCCLAWNVMTEASPQQRAPGHRRPPWRSAGRRASTNPVGRASYAWRDHASVPCASSSRSSRGGAAPRQQDLAASSVTPQATSTPSAGSSSGRSLKGLLKCRLDVARGQAAQERANHQRLQRVRPGYAVAQHAALEAQLADGLLGALLARAAKELADLVLQRLLQDQPGPQVADPVSTGSCSRPIPANTSSDSERNRSLGATLAMRAYLHQLRLAGQSGGYASLTFSRLPGRDPGCRAGSYAC